MEAIGVSTALALDLLSCSYRPSEYAI